MFYGRTFWWCGEVALALIMGGRRGCLLFVIFCKGD
jgi:hypothetical protein